MIAEEGSNIFFKQSASKKTQWFVIINKINDCNENSFTQINGIFVFSIVLVRILSQEKQQVKESFKDISKFHSSNFHFPSIQSVISRLAAFKESTTLDHFSNSVPRVALIDATHPLSLEYGLRKSSNFSSTTLKSGRKILFVMIFGEREKVLRFSRDYFMLPACTDLRKDRVCYFSVVLLTLSLEGIKGKMEIKY